MATCRITPTRKRTWRPSSVSDGVLNAIDALGVDYAEVTAKLEAEAVQKFQSSWDDLLQTVGAALEASR